MAFLRSCLFHPIASTSRASSLIFYHAIIKRTKSSSTFRHSVVRTKKDDSTHKSTQNVFIFTPYNNQSKHVVKQYFDYLLILDFEATCENGIEIQPYQEIIEFPVMKLNVRTWSIESTFHKYIRPVGSPRLTSFCTQLTGIIQDMVDNEKTLEEVLREFDDWMMKENLLDHKFAFVTCGDWDLKVMLPLESQHKNINLPEYFSEWINIKKSYADHTGKFEKGMKGLLNALQLKHEGRHHSGIDDVMNIAAITAKLGHLGYKFKHNSWINPKEEMREEKCL